MKYWQKLSMNKKALHTIIIGSEKYRFYNNNMTQEEMKKRAEVEHKLYLKEKKKKIPLETLLLIKQEGIEQCY